MKVMKLRQGALQWENFENEQIKWNNATGRHLFFDKW